MWLIDADVFLLELTHWKGTDGNYHENSQTFYTLDEVMDAIEEADVVRCKDCKHLCKSKCVGGYYNGCELLEGRDGSELAVDLDWFCAYGERGEDE